MMRWYTSEGREVGCIKKKKSLAPRPQGPLCKGLGLLYMGMGTFWLTCIVQAFLYIFCAM